MKMIGGFALMLLLLPGVLLAQAPNPILTAIPPNTALDLGAYTSDALCGVPIQVTDFSRFTYDSQRHQLLLFGGGHASTPRTDVDVLQLLHAGLVERLYAHARPGARLLQLRPRPGPLGQHRPSHRPPHLRPTRLRPLDRRPGDALPRPRRRLLHRRLGMGVGPDGPLPSRHARLELQPDRVQQLRQQRSLPGGRIRSGLRPDRDRGPHRALDLRPRHPRTDRAGRLQPGHGLRQQPRLFPAQPEDVLLRARGAHPGVGGDAQPRQLGGFHRRPPERDRRRPQLAGIRVGLRLLEPDHRRRAWPAASSTPSTRSPPTGRAR